MGCCQGGRFQQRRPELRDADVPTKPRQTPIHLPVEIDYVMPSRARSLRDDHNKLWWKPQIVKLFRWSVVCTPMKYADVQWVSGHDVWAMEDIGRLSDWNTWLSWNNVSRPSGKSGPLFSYKFLHSSVGIPSHVFFLEGRGNFFSFFYKVGGETSLT
jgi:hypothetical protein